MNETLIGTAPLKGTQIITPEIQAQRERNAAFLAQMAKGVLEGEVIGFGMFAINTQGQSQYNVWGNDSIDQSGMVGHITLFWKSATDAVAGHRAPPPDKGGSGRGN